MKRILTFAIATILGATATLPLSSNAEDVVVEASGGTVVCGYLFDNVEDFTNWNVKNVNFEGNIRIVEITFYDEFGNLDIEFDPIPTGAYHVIDDGILGPMQSDVFKSKNIDDFSGWASGDTLPKKGSVLIRWSSVDGGNLLPLGVSRIRVKKAIANSGRTAGIARDHSGCRTTSLEFAD